MLQTDDLHAAQNKQKYYLCADCWGHLVVENAADGYLVHCTTDGCPCRGYVTKKFVERSEVQGRIELVEAKTALRQAGVLPKRSEKEILSELGFE